MLATITHDIILATETCCNCHIAFAMPQELQVKCKQDGTTFYCPNGHPQVYSKPEITKLQEQLNRANSDAQYWRQRQVDIAAEKLHVERQLRTRKGQITKIKNRIGKGVCPCCNRTFENVARHMESQHPEFIKETV